MLNMYVQQNKEVDMYPMEYILLGRDLLLNSLEVLLITLSPGHFLGRSRPPALTHQLR